MDSGAGGTPSPRRAVQLQGPKPPPLKIDDKSHKISKHRSRPPVPPAHLVQQGRHHEPTGPPPPRAPVILYDASPRVHYVQRSEFRSLVQQLTGLGSSSPSSPLSPAARLAVVEKSVRPADVSRPSSQFLDMNLPDGQFAQSAQALDLPGPSHGILSPIPSSLLPASSPGLFVQSPLPMDPSFLTFLNDLSPMDRTRGDSGGGGVDPWTTGNTLWSTRGFGCGDPFMLSPSTLLATPVTSPGAALMDIFNILPDL